MKKLLYSLLFHLVSYALECIRVIVQCLFYLFYLGKKKTVPAVKNDYLLISATDLTKQIREGKVQCEDVVRAYVQRNKQIHPYINAVVDERFENAIEEAKRVDVLIATKGDGFNNLETEKPLLGVPVSVKNLFSVKELRFTCGSYLFEDRIAERDAESVAALRDAGAIILCNTNTPEFGLYLESCNKIHGRTKNPYDTTRTAGASSGGEGALGAAAGSLIGLGNDLAGSVRIPSLYGGIFAHKPTAGLISNDGTEPIVEVLEDYLTPGPMCRFASDLILSMKVLSRKRAPDLTLGKSVDFSNLKMYYYFDRPHIFSPNPDKETLACIDKVLKHFEETHMTKVQKAKINGVSRATGISLLALNRAIKMDLPYYLTGGKLDINPLLELLKYAFGSSKLSFMGIVHLNLSRLLHALTNTETSRFTKMLHQLQDEFSEILDDNAVIVLPTSARPSPYQSEWPFHFFAVGYTAIFNILGYPATHCTVGRNTEDLPLGLQIVAGKYQDNLTLAVALEIERAFGGWTSPGVTST